MPPRAICRQGRNGRNGCNGRHGCNGRNRRLAQPVGRTVYRHAWLAAAPGSGSPCGLSLEILAAGTHELRHLPLVQHVVRRHHRLGLRDAGRDGRYARRGEVLPRRGRRREGGALLRGRERRCCLVLLGPAIRPPPPALLAQCSSYRPPPTWPLRPLSHLALLVEKPLPHVEEQIGRAHV